MDFFPNLKKVDFQKFNLVEKPLFSIIIPTWNNLSYLKKCIESIRKNSTYQHQIIVHVNDGIDGTLEWLKSEKIEYSHSLENIGVCYSVNFAATLSTTDYILYLNDDMYVCPEWDYFLWNEVEKLDSNLFYISGTMIEHTFSKSKAVITPFDFGKDLNTFKETELLKNYSTFDKPDWCGASWPPSLVHKQIWNLVGGFSTEFSPGIASDPDFSIKLWKAGVRIFKGVSKSRVYHFMSKSTKKIPLNHGSHQFLLKWGISISTFYKFYLKMGEPYLELPAGPEETIKFRIKKIRDRLKKLFY
jgi:glycosyltransferase involved in cell wall biosynthesis